MKKWNKCTDGKIKVWLNCITGEVVKMKKRNAFKYFKADGKVFNYHFTRKNFTKMYCANWLF